MLRERIPSSLKHKNSVTICLVRIQQVLRQYSAETATTDDDSVEWPSIVLRTAIGPLRILVRAVHRLVEAVAHITAENVHGEIGKLSCPARRHDRTPTLVHLRICNYDSVNFGLHMINGSHTSE